MATTRAPTESDYWFQPFSTQMRARGGDNPYTHYLHPQPASKRRTMSFTPLLPLLSSGDGTEYNHDLWHVECTVVWTFHCKQIRNPIANMCSLFGFYIYLTCGNRTKWFDAANAKARSWTRTWATSIHVQFPQPVSLTDILMLPSSHLFLRLPSWYFPRCFSTKILWTFHISPILVT